MCSRILLLAAVLLSVFIAEPAHAAPKTHDGFYLRLALGFGGLNMDRSVDAEFAGNDFSTGDSSITGPVGHFEATVGGSPAAGFVIGATFLSYRMDNAELENEFGDTIDLDGPLVFAVLGPGIDWFPDEHGGFHLGGVIGFAGAFAKLPDEQLFEGIGGGGGALSFALGYDWWIAREWSLGGILRLTGATINGEDTEAGVTANEESSIGAITLAFTGLFH